MQQTHSAKARYPSLNGKVVFISYGRAIFLLCLPGLWLAQR